MSIWIKICGTTSLEDARSAADAGADALGFIFAPSPRRISPRDAARITSELPAAMEKIGVFVNQSRELIVDTLERAGLTGVQLHGDEDVRFARELKNGARHGKQLRVIKTISLSDGSLDKSIAFEDGAEEVFDSLLLDSGNSEKRGGTGKRFDWQSAAPMVRLVARKFKIVVAGGLSAGSVTEAVKLLDPWGVDVVSGVEKEPGRKDPGKIREFIAAVREAELHAAGQKQK
jgi:phosphoribosylanthranilate isomerase